MKKTLLTIALLATTTAHADQYTTQVPTHGCYKNNASDQCVEVTLIKCGTGYTERHLTKLVRLYGPVVAEFCTERNYQMAMKEKHFKTIRMLAKKLGMSNKEFLTISAE